MEGVGEAQQRPRWAALESSLVAEQDHAPPPGGPRGPKRGGAWGRAAAQGPPESHLEAPSFCLPGLFSDLPTGNTLNGGSVFAPDTLHLGLGSPWRTPRHQCADGAGRHSCRLLQCACGTHLNEASVQDPPSQAGPAPCPLLHASRSPVTERPQSHHFIHMSQASSGTPLRLRQPRGHDALV